MKVRIYQRPKNAMQSGRARTGQWVLEFDPATSKRADPLTGWTGAGDTSEQVRLTFPDAGSAVAYAKTHGFEYSVTPLGPHTLKLQAYADNFR